MNGNSKSAGRKICRLIFHPGEHFAFGGIGQQAKLLEAEGITVTDGKVNLEEFQWQQY